MDSMQQIVLANGLVEPKKAKQITYNINIISKGVKDKLTGESAAKNIQSTLKMLENQDNFYAQRILDVTIHSLITIYPKDQFREMYSESNFIRTLKQVSCIYIAETSYGKPPNKDVCDQTNISQIFPDSFLEIKRLDLCQFKDEDLVFLGSKMSCNKLQPLERELCCKELASLDSSSILTSNINCKPTPKKKNCMTKEELIPILEYHKDNNSDVLDSVNDNKMNLKVKVSSLIKSCHDFTTNANLGMVPAIKEHSIFASILYLKANNYKPMTDEKFQEFAPKYYNRASDYTQEEYSIKLEPCLKILNEKENIYKKIKSQETIFQSIIISAKNKIKTLDYIANFGSSTKLDSKKIELIKELEDMQSKLKEIYDSILELKKDGTVDFALKNIRAFEANHNIKVIEDIPENLANELKDINLNIKKVKE